LLAVACGEKTDKPFPTEAESRARAQRGMTREEAVNAFGTPTIDDQAAADQGRRVLIYFAPVAVRRLPVEGYTGFELYFEADRLVNYSPVTGKPAYSARTPE
jgi:hypothetical protein